MLQWFKQLFKGPSGYSRKKLTTQFFTLLYPADYTCLREGGFDVSGFCKDISKGTLGVIRFTPLPLQPGWNENRQEKGGGEFLQIGPHKCRYTKEMKVHSSTDYIFWSSVYEEIVMESFSFFHKNVLFLFTYRIPLAYVKRVEYKQEREMLLEMIASVNAKH